jgi:TonB family protein
MMSAHIQQAGVLSGRSVTFIAVVGLHAMIISALIAIKVVPELIDPGPQSLVLVPVIEPVEPTPVLKPPSSNVDPFAPRSVVLPLPGEILVSTTETAVPHTGETVTQGSDVVGVPEVVPTPRAATALQFQITRSTDDYYPSASVLAEEHGVAIVRVCVDPAGRIDGQPVIESSSGHRRLDQAALRWARESLRFTPATVDGLAVAACKGFRVNFALR